MTHRSWAILGSLGCLLLVLVPFGGALLSGGLPGAGPDVESTAWGMWWFQQSWLGPAWGGATELVNHPHGAHGSVLGLSGALTWALVDPLLGPGRAASFVNLTQLLGLAAAVGWLGRRLGLSAGGAVGAAVALLVARVLVFDAAEASIVAAAALPLPLGLVACTSRDARGALGLAICGAWLALENPYLAPVLPSVALVWTLLDRHLLRLLGALGCLLGVAGVALLFRHTSNPDYPLVSDIVGDRFSLGPWLLTAVDQPWSRATLGDLLLPRPVSWTTGVADATSADGGGYLGYSLLLLAGVGVWARKREALPWLALAVGALVISLGSVPFGPFLVLNALMEAVARPLTQPSRFVVVGLVPLALLAGMAVQALEERGPRWALGGIALLMVDGLVLGGGSLRPPVTPLPQASCVEELQGPVAVWSPTSPSGESYDGSERLLQLLHEQPSAHRGIASWRVDHPVRAELEEAGMDGRGPADAGAMSELGYRWLVALPDSEDPRGLGAPASSCEGYRIWAL